MLAPLVDEYFRAPTKELLAEIRLNEAKLGATPEDRQRLRWKIDPPAGEELGDAKPSARTREDPRRRLAAVPDEA
jgi:hypothetical protein